MSFSPHASKTTGTVKTVMTVAAMLLASIWIVAGIGGLGCSVETRSSEFRCENQSDCSGSRRCEDGWCVSRDNTRVDSGTTSGADASGVCPSECDSCSGTVCEITCASIGTCLDTVKCPAGFDCAVNCRSTQSCAAGVDCREANSCMVACESSGSCAGEIQCSQTGRCDIDCAGVFSCTDAITSGSGPTTIECGGQGSCSGTNDCSDACSCDIDCANNASCQVPATCPSQQCTTNENGCQDNTPACDTC